MIIDAAQVLSNVDFAAVLQAQRDDEIASVDTMKLRAIRKAFEAAGVEFVTCDLGKPGVRLRKI